MRHLSSLHGSYSFHRTMIFCFLTLAYALAFLHRMSPAVAATEIMSDFQSSSAIMGLLASAYFYPYAFMQAPCGILTDKLGTRKLVTTALVMAALSCAVFSMAESVTGAFISRMGIGFGLALVLVPANKALARWFTPKDFILAASTLLAIATGVGVLLAGTPLALLCSAVGWRSSFAGIAGLTLLAGVGVWLFVRDTPQDLGFSQQQEGNAEKNENTTPIDHATAIRLVLSKRNFWAVAFTFMLTTPIFFSFAGLWAGVFLTEVGGLSHTTMGTVISVSGIISAAAPICFASIARKVASRKKMIVAIAAVTLFTLLWAILRNGNWSGMEISLWFGIFSFVCTAPPGLYFTTVKEFYPLAISGTATGLLYAMPMLLSALYQPLVGWLLDTGQDGILHTAKTFQPVFLFFCLSAAAALLSALFMKEN